MNIIFTESEKKAYLIKKGYHVFEKEESYLSHLHGSVFTEHTKTIVLAVKAGESFLIDKAFELELRNTLLNL